MNRTALEEKLEQAEIRFNELSQNKIAIDAELYRVQGEHRKLQELIDEFFDTGDKEVKRVKKIKEAE